MNLRNEVLAIEKCSRAAGRGAHEHCITCAMRNPALEWMFKTPGIPSFRIKANERRSAR
jgi:hypothetical protein